MTNEGQSTMSRNTRQFRNEVTALAEDARALLAATANVAEDQVVQARQRLASALERGENVYHRVRNEAVAEARATNLALHEHPYRAIGLAFGVGLLLGCFASCRWCGDGGGSRSGAGF
jgi:ElaB/YqjD/DUF883 family membrane-anchored ribosome-binding protein